jgi:hypothetical protein
MQCYFCELNSGSGGMNYGVRQAVAICKACGAGVCQEHIGGERDEGTPEPILCPACHMATKMSCLEVAQH